VQNVQELPILHLVNEITNSTESRQALRWLARELAWERVLTGLRADDAVDESLPRAA
jgi:hypothetical protein